MVFDKGGLSRVGPLYITPTPLFFKLCWEGMHTVYTFNVALDIFNCGISGVEISESTVFVMLRSLEACNPVLRSQARSLLMLYQSNQ